MCRVMNREGHTGLFSNARRASQSAGTENEEIKHATAIRRILLGLAGLAGLALIARAQELDSGDDWPREIQHQAGTVLVYQPQPETFSGNQLTGRCAVAVTPAGQTEVVFGAVWLQARVLTDREARIVDIIDVQTTKMRFPDAKPEQLQLLESILESAMSMWDVRLSLDRLLTTLEHAELEERRSQELEDVRGVAEDSGVLRQLL